MGSNYAGVSNIDINPSNMVTSKLYWDVNLIGVNAYLYNNSLYAKPQFIFPLFFKDGLTIARTSDHAETKQLPADVLIEENIQPFSYLYTGGVIKGPSFMYTNGVHAFAINSSFRAEVSALGIPELFMKNQQDIDSSNIVNDVSNIKNRMTAGTMAWLELGGSYARKLKENNRVLLTGGVSIKLLTGYSAAFLSTNGIAPSYKDSTMALNLDYKHAINDDTKPISLFNPLGFGAALDIGVTIIKKKSGRNSQLHCPSLIRKNSPSKPAYRWKLGLSLLDFGGIYFSQNAFAYSYQNIAYPFDSLYTLKKIKAKTLAQYDRALYNKLSRYGNASLENSFFMWVPTAASAQFDYNINDFFYVNASIVQRLIISTQAHVARMNSFALTPRYETAKLEVALPIIVNEYEYLNMGMMFRYKSFFIGTDQLGSTLGMTALNGLNLYLGIKVSSFGSRKEPKIRY